jgi:hypothetical protein
MEPLTAELTPLIVNFVQRCATQDHNKPAPQAKHPSWPRVEKGRKMVVDDDMNYTRSEQEKR